MNDFINRQTLLDRFRESCNGECGCCEYNGSDSDTGENCRLIHEAPTADVQPVKRGKWIDVTETAVSGKTKDGRELEINIVSGKCSCCQHYAEQVNILPPIMKYSICPNCGAKMEEE